MSVKSNRSSSQNSARGHFVSQFTNARQGRAGWARVLNAVGRIGPGLSTSAADDWWVAAARKVPNAGEPSGEARRALAQLADSLREESRLNLIGRFAAKDESIRMAANHLRINQLLSARPEIRSTQWPDPVFIIGLPRTGTTFLHQLMANDPRSRTIPYWESFDPIPPGEFEGQQNKGEDRRADHVDKMLKQLESLSPDYHAIHPMSGDSTEECVALFMHAFRTLQFDFQYDAPGYRDWLMAQDARIAYRAYQDQLRIIHYFRPVGERFVLKDPTHLVHLETVLELFPGAKIIFTHRDPRTSFSSIASLISHTRAIMSDEVDPVRVGQELMSGVWPAALERAVAIRDRLSPDQFVDVRQLDLRRDPVGTLQSIYSAFGWAWERDAEESVGDFLAEEASHPIRRHEHRPEGFGLTGEGLRERFKGYLERFDL